MKTKNEVQKKLDRKKNHAEMLCTRDANCLFGLLNFNFAYFAPLKCGNEISEIYRFMLNEVPFVR